MKAQERNCASCARPLSRYNRDQVCSACRNSREQGTSGDHPGPGTWRDAAMTEAILRWDMGAIIKLYRSATGTTQVQLSHLTGIEQSEVSRFERGKRNIRSRPQLVSFLASLGASPEVLGAVPLRPLARLPARPQASRAAATDAPAHIDADAVEHVVLSLQQLDNSQGGDHLCGPAAQQLAGVMRTLEDGPPPRERTRLWTAAAQLGQIVGWIAIDAGRRADAQHYLTQALRASHESGNLSLAANSLAYMSISSLYYGTPQDAEALARTAQDIGSAAPSRRVRGMLATRVARAAARNGNAALARKALGQAEAHASVHRDGDPTWLTYFDHVEVLAQQGACLLDLGEHQASLDALDEALHRLDQLPAPRYRDKVNYLLRSAKAVAALGDMDHACHLGHRALDTYRNVDSTRMWEQITDMRDELLGQGAARTARNLAERIAQGQSQRHRPGGP